MIGDVSEPCFWIESILPDTSQHSTRHTKLTLQIILKSLLCVKIKSNWNQTHGMTFKIEATFLGQTSLDRIVLFFSLQSIHSHNGRRRHGKVGLEACTGYNVSNVVVHPNHDKSRREPTITR